MGNGFHVRKGVALASLVAAVGAIVVIIALSVRLAQEKSRNAGTLPINVKPTSSAPEEPWDHYRLPNTLSPISYNVTLWPRLESDADGLYQFSGNCTVVFKCTRETDLILIHSKELNLTLLDGFHAKLTGLNGPAPRLKKTWEEIQTEYLVVQLDGPLQANSSYELFTEFAGKLSPNQKGFFRSVYIEDGEEKVIATTQMQPTYARKAFPCFDEPALKAVFHVTLIHPQNTTALSNSMASGKSVFPGRIIVDGQDLVRTSFEPTKIMSTYLLAFAVCDFGHIRTEAGSKKRNTDYTFIRVWARRKAIQRGMGNYALEKARPILPFYEKYFNTSYPLKKSDQIAIPGFGPSAMENWGLITYGESVFLHDLEKSFNEDKETVVYMISHELAHMWFGNLVTLRWWNDLWLNEGFASYISSLGSDHAEPTWNLTEVIEILEAMVEDAFFVSHPLSVKEAEVRTPQEILSLFDGITYSKGAAVIRMMSNFVTEAVLTKGLQTYLKEFQYKNTVPKDLWKHLQMAVDEAGISLPRPVEEIMNRWVLQMGFPLITINTRTGNVTQKHFLSNPKHVVDRTSEFNYTWFVPITWMKNGKEEQKYWLLSKEDMALGPSDWLVANINLTGFFRVNYDAENWERIFNKLNSRHEDIPLLSRAQIIDDAFNLADLEMVNMTVALRTTSYLDKEVEYMPWRRADSHLENFFHILRPRGIYGPLQAFFREKVTPLFHRHRELTLNWTKSPTRHSDLYNQMTVIKLACKLEVKDCSQLTLTWFREWMKNSTTNKIRPSLRDAIYCSAMAAGGVEEWDFMWSIYRKNDTSDPDNLIYALSCTRQPWLINRYLEYCLDPEKVSEKDVISAITYMAYNPVGQPLLWDFVRTNWEDLAEKVCWHEYQNFSCLFALQLLQFKEELKKQLSSVDGTFEEALKTVEDNMKWIERYKKEVHGWLISETSEEK
uniref:Aminopeptidase n=1 Tax=Oryzias latipes TaxID=8090 RepID=A0A3P9JI76_ORYLA